MKSNPANDIPDHTWYFLKDGAHKHNIRALRDAVYSLIKMTTQKTAEQSRANNRNDMPFQCLDMVKWVVICEAVALVLSGELDKLDDGGKNGR